MASFGDELCLFIRASHSEYDERWFQYMQIKSGLWPHEKRLLESGVSRSGNPVHLAPCRAVRPDLTIRFSGGLF